MASMLVIYNFVNRHTAAFLLNRQKIKKLYEREIPLSPTLKNSIFRTNLFFLLQLSQQNPRQSNKRSGTWYNGPEADTGRDIAYIAF